MKLKLDENGHVVVIDGCPVYIHDDGKEIPFNAKQATDKISALNAEAKTQREAKEKAETALRQFEGIENVEKAKEALKTVANLEAKKLIDAGEAEKVKQEAIKVYEEKLATEKARGDKLQGQLHNELIGGSFARSKFVSDKLAIPADFALSHFGKHFSIGEDGQIIAKDMHGNEIYSRIVPGQRAGFEEALETLIEAYPNKDQILKSSQSSGSGAGGGSAKANAPKSLADCKTDEERIAYVQSNS